MYDIALEVGCFLIIAPPCLIGAGILVNKIVPGLNILQIGALAVVLFGLVYLILQFLFGKGNFS